jgi:uncharacterized protein DUF4751
MLRVFSLFLLINVFLLSAQPIRPAQTLDLTGLWLDDTGGGGVYRVRQVGNKVYWGIDASSKGSFANIFVGEISGNSITGMWVDLPGSPALGGGNLTLRIESNNKLVKVGENPCCYRAQSWTRQGTQPGTAARQFIPNSTINYISWDGGRWAAQLKGNGFLHAPNGDWSKAHSDSIINYISWDGARWTARVQGNGFLHAPNGDWGRAHPDSIINYISWDNAKLTARIQ